MPYGIIRTRNDRPWHNHFSKYDPVFQKQWCLPPCITLFTTTPLVNHSTIVDPPFCQ